ncbi:hypothetical protein B0J13DRAFT_627439 [Dactylonectria estremocensis]|uniref:Uncharacterized protein n=1 Tax=Dactylonectria estremocensis TaxID=1079267 RepID=A0A9P9IQP6_9HYPO|nr:hypothetical protein B0J13DRAFT_627439 [Dactylonectria estremocensis]
MVETPEAQFISRAIHLYTIALASCALASLASAASIGTKKLKAPYCPLRPVSRHQQRLIFEEFLEKAYINYNANGAALDHFAEDYIQHSPSALSGRDEAIKALSVLSPEDVNTPSNTSALAETWPGSSVV